jgi:hypothetical protein
LLETKKEMNQTINQWTALNRFLFIYKAVGAAVAVLCLILGIVCIVLASKSPIVIVASENENFYFQGRQGQVEIKELDVKKFVERFVVRYYNWQELNPDQIIKNILPLATDGFKENSFLNLKARREKEFVGKKISQSASGINVQVSKQSTIATFDVILRIDNIPLIVPMQVAFQLVKGSQTEWNPLGLYVNTLTTHEGK